MNKVYRCQANQEILLLVVIRAQLQRYVKKASFLGFFCIVVVDIGLLIPVVWIV